MNGAKLSTLCYIEQDGKYLMLHRTVKKNDVNKDKWIGIGGHFEQDESPEECILRETMEETGYMLTSFRYRGIVTFVSGDGVTEYMHLFTADGISGEPVPCDEGELEWIDKKDVWNLNLWEGDKIFFLLLEQERPFFSLKLVYNGKGVLKYAALDGRPMELFDLLDENGEKTGVIEERSVAHYLGNRHAAVHIWILRRKTGEDKAAGENLRRTGEKLSALRKDKYEVLLQKRSMQKDSNPGEYDVSAAGHVASGDTALNTAVREIKEELGLTVAPEQLCFLGMHEAGFEAVFNGRIFRDDEMCSVYVYLEDDAFRGTAGNDAGCGGQNVSSEEQTAGRRGTVGNDAGCGGQNVSAEEQDTDQGEDSSRLRGRIDADRLRLQKEEVESVCWMDLDECERQVREALLPNCINVKEFEMVRKHLEEHR